jgi:hypothetical protein
MCCFSSLLSKESHALLEELTEEIIYANIRPDFVKERKKTRKTTLEVTALKEKLIATSAEKTFCPSNREVRLLR